MNQRAVRAVIRKDLMSVIRSKGVMIPLIVVPLIFFVLIPVLVSLAPNLVSMPGLSLQELDSFIQGMPAGLQNELSGYSESQVIIVLMVVYIFAPMFLIVPLMVSSVIAADSFAGEKERKTIEALLYTPLTDFELFTAKLLSAWIPAVLVAFLGFAVYTAAANLAGWPLMGKLFFPNWMWVILVVWVAPAAAGLGLASMVLVSSRVRGFQEANQIGGMVVLPILLLVIGQAAGVMYFNVRMVLLLGIFLWGIDGGLIWWGVKTFQRERLITGGG
ncbi:MAG: ABC transporter permease subunit [Anaerolineales bacterium]|nr:ABC transporter permease subunit [Anaerolineales bacterium]